MQGFTTFFYNHTGLFTAAFIVSGLLMIVEYLRLQRDSRYSVDPVEAVRLINHHHATVVDIRSNDLFRKGHILDALSLPGREVLDTPKKIEKYKSKPLILVCNNGIESMKLAPQLTKIGYNAHSMPGGLRAWANANMPLVRE